MRPTLAVLALAAASFAAMPHLVAAQSIADVARQEGERRKTLTNEGKTLTNADLGAAPSQSSPAPSSTPEAAKPDASKADGKGDKDTTADAAKKSDDKVKDQKYWSELMKGLNDKLAEDKILSDAMQTRINSLTTDFVNRDDPAQKAVIASDRQKALDELARLKQAVLDDTKAIDATQEDARKAGVPPGWLR